MWYMIRIFIVVAFIICLPGYLYADDSEHQAIIMHFEAYPKQGEGIYQFMNRYGIPRSKMAYRMFHNLNVECLDNSDTLFTDRFYKLPIVIASFYDPFDEILRKMGVSAYRQKVFEFNTAYNSSFNSTHPDSVPLGQILLIPDLRSGFYETDKPAPVPVSIPVVQDDNVAGELSVPYPDIKNNIEKGSLSSALSGYYFILDPGHGGNDPGTNPHVERGDGLSAHAFEAPLVYDVTLRLMKFLMLHDADVLLTHFSPEFGIRNEKNPQDYRNHRYNLSDNDIRRDTPAQSLRTRKQIVSTIKSRKYNKGKKIVFLSIHADYLPNKKRDLPIMVYYHRLPKLDGYRSRNFARKLAESMTGSSQNTKAQGLGVLYKNPADLEVLIELANLNNKHGAWRLRDYNYREKLAKIVSDGLIDVLGTEVRQATK